LGESVGLEEISAAKINRVYPNPASAITCIEVNSLRENYASIILADFTGRVVATIHDGALRRGESNFFFNAELFAPGVYQVVIQTKTKRQTMPVLVQ